MTWGELKQANIDTPDYTEIYIDAPNEDDDIPMLVACEIDEVGDLLLIPDDGE